MIKTMKCPCFAYISQACVNGEVSYQSRRGDCKYIGECVCMDGEPYNNVFELWHIDL